VLVDVCGSCVFRAGTWTSVPVGGMVGGPDRADAYEHWKPAGWW
jgi:hypothetical protein